jgi:hypothetical protein
MEEAALRQDETTCEVAALERNSTVTGTLTTSDCPLDDGTFVDFWTFDGYSGETVTIDLQSDDFDTFLLPGETLPARGHDLGTRIQLPEPDQSRQRSPHPLPDLGVCEVTGSCGLTRAWLGLMFDARVETNKNPLGYRWYEGTAGTHRYGGLGAKRRASPSSSL